MGYKKRQRELQRTTDWWVTKCNKSGLQTTMGCGLQSAIKVLPTAKGITKNESITKFDSTHLSLLWSIMLLLTPFPKLQKVFNWFQN